MSGHSPLKFRLMARPNRWFLTAREFIEMDITCSRRLFDIQHKAAACHLRPRGDRAPHARGECSSRAILIPSCIAASISPISPCRLASTLASKLAKSCLITAMASWSEQKNPNVRRTTATELNQHLHVWSEWCAYRLQYSRKDLCLNRRHHCVWSNNPPTQNRYSNQYVLQWSVSECTVICRG